MHYRDKKNRKYIIKRRATGIYYTLSHRTDPLCISVNKTETVHIVHCIFGCVLKCLTCMRLSVSTIKSFCFTFVLSMACPLHHC